MKKTNHSVFFNYPCLFGGIARLRHQVGNDNDAKGTNEQDGQKGTF